MQQKQEKHGSLIRQEEGTVGDYLCFPKGGGDKEDHLTWDRIFLIISKGSSAGALPGCLVLHLY